ncbi:hypothetical protein B484DRAFT_397468 [Ochromonadaceae sp. CCMP2298]|nr:hypothetical protein B484DRAFT_397468 [Ochromonadaceae sp. CCMP2298]|mmetsp:Transcript_20395/g.45407  ORF Transcript_20395/g.45407 Transcript_20395/m.45407 type:complete len:985 (+) Transcript_20395:337-3291(+)|eukprot:CAMPEP_0173227500 /NCGR_PEP_ID=MMETSP1142-20121109/5995_1 /TAXON_ID=483371 /ORGANISM="non described non described, Strain CCMP2298" /LENGTH=984 /DNA_ID=CAMNT_0014156017 /DNA_START=334 /DNA_END=3288 /DNA_ORIENTATION=+
MRPVADRGEPQKEVAAKFFHEIVLPRRARDYDGEDDNYRKFGTRRILYRKVAIDEEDRAEAYPVCGGVGSFSQFGIGIGIYFSQLLVLSLTCLVGGAVMMIAAAEYAKSSYGISSSDNPLVLISAACADLQEVTATVGCSDNAASCTASMRPNCELSAVAGWSDLAMSMIVLAAILGSTLIDSRIEEQLDVRLQTAQDYSVVVTDPDADADNPDEWYEFFSRFGKVRFVTITRRNLALTSLIVRKHVLCKKIASAKHPPGRFTARMKKIDEELEAAYALPYPACRVFITFDLEQHQRLCLQEMEVPDIVAILDLKALEPRKLFRGKNVLDVTEPPEPEAVLWENLETSRGKLMWRETVSNVGAACVLVACYYLVTTVSAHGSTLLLTFTIGAADVLMPIILEAVVDYALPMHEGKRQSDLQERLFLARLLLSTVFPYFDSKWNEVLTPSFVMQIFSVQVAVCFITPLITVMDLGGVLTRHVVAPLFADTQGEMNSMWSGTDWSLADRYTSIAKILFVSIYNCFLNPIGLLVAGLAFALVLFVDHYLILRRLRPMCMLDAKIARRLRQQGILAVAMHMGVTLRYIYSWPMDSAYVNSSGAYEKVRKVPPLNLFNTQVQPWMGKGQKEVLSSYRVAMIVVICLAAYYWVVDPLLQTFWKLFCRQISVTGAASDIPFSSIPKTPAYVSTVRDRKDLYFCSYTRDMPDKNKQRLLRPAEGDMDDLSGYVPTEFQPHVLSVVKYYGDRDEHVRRMLGAAESEVGKEDSSTGGHLSGSATATHPKYATTSGGTLHAVVTQLPPALAHKIDGQTVSCRSYKAFKFVDSRGAKQSKDALDLEAGGGSGGGSGAGADSQVAEGKEQDRVEGTQRNDGKKQSGGAKSTVRDSKSGGGWLDHHIEMELPDIYNHRPAEGLEPSETNTRRARPSRLSQQLQLQRHRSGHVESRLGPIPLEDYAGIPRISDGWGASSIPDQGGGFEPSYAFSKPGRK